MTLGSFSSLHWCILGFIPLFFSGVYFLKKVKAPPPPLLKIVFCNIRVGWKIIQFFIWYNKKLKRRLNFIFEDTMMVWLLGHGVIDISFFRHYACPEIGKIIFILAQKIFPFLSKAFSLSMFYWRLLLWRDKHNTKTHLHTFKQQKPKYSLQ